MIVLYWMTPDPHVVSPGSTLLDVHELSTQHGVRRLPVVEADGRLVGIVARRDLAPVLPARKRGQPLTPEERELLAGRRVAEFMIREPITCNAEDHVEQVCRTLCREKVGALPVLKRGHLVGIISETDLMRALADLTYEGEKGKRISLRLPPHPTDEVLYNMFDLCRRYHVQLLAVLTHTVLDGSALMATLRVDGPTVDLLVQALWKEGHKVVDVS